MDLKAYLPSISLKQGSTFKHGQNISQALKRSSINSSFDRREIEKESDGQDKGEMEGYQCLELASVKQKA